MSSSIDTIRRLANLSGNYVISDENAKIKKENPTGSINPTGSRQAIIRGLTKDELKSYNVFPIISIDDKQITYVNPEDVEYNNQTLKIEGTKYLTFPRSKWDDTDNIVIICKNSEHLNMVPENNFWCLYINPDYYRYYTDGFRSPSRETDYKYLWYYGKKIGSKGGRPATFRQRRLKRAAAKSRRRATRTRRTHRRV